MPEPTAAAARAGLRVLVLASTFPRWRGDTEPPFVFNLCRDLARNDGMDITVAVPDAEGARRYEELDGVHVTRFPYFWPRRLQRLAYGGMLPNLKRNRWLWLQVPFFLAAELVAAWRLVRKKDIDIIHAHWLVPQGLVAAALSRLTGKPVVVTAHGADVYGVGGKLQSRLKSWALRGCTRVTAVSTDLRQSIERIEASCRAPVEVISMGVDTTLFHPKRRDPVLRERVAGDGPLILFVGRLAEKKGVRYLIEAMPVVLERFPAAKLLILGRGPLEDELRLLVRSLGLESSVIFGGAKRPEELPPYYASADVFVGPSIVSSGGDTESFGLVFAEAMASSCPVVASDVGGIRELVRHGETGALVPQRDPAAVAGWTCRLLEDSQLRRRFAVIGRRRVRRLYDASVIASRYAAVLQGCCQEEQSSHAQAAVRELEGAAP